MNLTGGRCGEKLGRFEASNEQEKSVTTAEESVARRELEKKAKAEGRLPPGQSLTLKWPVLHYGSVPQFDAEKWDFKISGEVEAPVKLSWKEFSALPKTEVTSDFHCVTRWSRLDNRWKGVLFTDVLKLVAPKADAKFALV